MFNPNASTPWQRNQNTIVISDSDDSDDDSSGPDPMQVEFPSRHIPHPSVGGYNRYAVDMNSGPNHHPLNPAISPYHTTIEQEKKVRSRLREERHAALCVLMDRELLTIQALAAQETLPQARRCFLARLMAPDDPDVAASIRADQFTIQRNPSSLRQLSSPTSSTSRPDPQIEHMNASKVVSWGIVDVCETDDMGWRRPDPESAAGASATTGGGGSSGVSSPASSTKTKGKMTPDRSRNKGRVSSGRQQHQRERGRRWSGAERQDHGASFQGM